MSGTELSSMMCKILVVDDSMLDRRLVVGLLRKLPEAQIKWADDPEHAMHLAERFSPDLIVTDWVMPQMDGLEFIRKMGEKHPDIPIILMTSPGNESTALEALEHGAANYLSKSQLADRLLDTVRQVYERVRAKRTGKRLMRCVEQLDVTFSLESDLSLVSALVNYLQQKLTGIDFCGETGQVRVAIAFEEILRNALYYGSLELNSAQVFQASKEGTLEELVRRRRNEIPFCDRRVSVRILLSADGARFVVRDQGPGFNTSKYTDPGKQNRLPDGSGRGLTLVKAFMDDVSFNEVGNEVTMTKLPDRVCLDVAEAISQRLNANINPEDSDLLIKMLENLEGEPASGIGSVRSTQ